MSDLTDKEKWECVARWLNALYLESLSKIPMFDIGNGDLSVKEALYSEVNYLPCAVCPIERKCRKSNVGKALPQYNFKIIEQFVEEDCIVDQFLPAYVFTKYREAHRADLSLNSGHPQSNDNKHRSNDK